ncbi:MAG TPA: ABC transporter permease [Vicinamibacterales bacterium]|jgi:putative ABC transport system permease protein|nr:ABC transporter permease [Vicinamibacterales bacterium]
MSRAYRALLALAPPRLRARHGAAMEELFADRLAAARARGRAAVLAAWVRAATDLVHARAASWRAPRVPLTVPVDERTTIMAGSDVRYAWRALLRQRGATALVVLMLALGIAANVAVFAIVNGLFLRPFPFPQPDRLVYINTAAPKWNLDVVGINYPDFDRWRRDQKLFDAITTYQGANFNLADAAGAVRVGGLLITCDFTKVFRIEPILGRTFTADEDKPKGPPVVVISAALWRERFGADPNVVGRTLRVDGTTRTIIGVMPPEASFPDDVKLWVPMAGDPAQPYQSYSGDGIGRLKPGVTAEQADADLKRAHQPIWDASDKDHVVTPFVKPLHETFVRDYRGAARTVTAAVAVLLLIACANVAAVMLARALARRREMGIRLALGSSRLRLLRQLLIENIMLAVAGGAIGLAAGRWALGAVIRLLPDQLPRWAAFHVDLRVIAFSFLVVVATVILFGWAPALHAVGGDLRSAVNASTNGTTGAPRGRRTLWFLVAGEFALAAALLVCGTLLIKAFDRVRHVDPGFRADHVLTFVVPLSEGTRPKPEQWMTFWDDLLARAKALPGVDAAGVVTCPPFGCHWGNFYVIDNALPRPDGKDPVVLTRLASPGYFEAMGIRLKSGRFFQEPDGRSKDSRVVIVNETFVRTFWGEGADGVGRRIRYRDAKAPWITVVGVVRDVKHYGLEQPMRPGLYFPVAVDPRPTLTVAIHSAQDPTSLMPAIREMVRGMDPEVPLFQVRTMEEAIRRSMALRAAFSWMLAVFAGLAFVLAVGGAYGVATYLVTQRTREIGIRVALGARTADIFRSVVAGGAGVVLAGVAGGLAASIFVARFLGDALFGVSTHDPGVLSFVTLILLGTALLANGFPARRAARLDPMRSLRTE